MKYANVLSNHPPHIIKKFANTISDRLSRILSTEKVFNESKSYYKDALISKCFQENNFLLMNFNSND